MPLTKPLNNNVLIEVLRDDDGVSRTDENETKNRGVLRDYHLEAYHLTASAAIELSEGFLKEKEQQLMRLVGKVVRWENYAEAGQTFEVDKKTYAQVPWWRLLSEEDAQ